MGAHEQLDYEPFDPTTKRTLATLRGPTGEVFRSAKGAPDIVLKMCRDVDRIGPLIAPLTEDYAARGIRCIGVARTDRCGDWCFVGLLTFLDPPRPDTADTIAKARELGVQVKMITGDHQAIAKETCHVLGMGTRVYGTEHLPSCSAETEGRLGVLGPLIENADGFAGVFPEHKFQIVDVLQQRGFVCGMTGDGVNDAPALKKADVGIAVEGSTDAARAAADIVLTDPGLSAIVTAIRLSREIFQRVKNYLIFRVVFSFVLGTFFAISVSTVQPVVTTGCSTLEQFSGCVFPQEYALPVYQNLPFCTSGAEASLCKCGGAVGQWPGPNPTTGAGAGSFEQIERLSSTCYYSQEQDTIVDALAVPMTDYFVLTILQLVLMIVFNDGCMVTCAWDNVKPSAAPKRWHLKRLFVLTAAMAVVVTAFQVSFLHFGEAALQNGGEVYNLNSQGGVNLNIFKSIFGITAPLQASQLSSLMYVSLSWAAFFTLMSGRCEGAFFETPPDVRLQVAMAFSMITTAVIGGMFKSAHFGFQAAPWEYIAVCFAWNMFAFFVLDTIKVSINKWGSLVSKIVNKKELPFVVNAPLCG